MTKTKLILLAAAIVTMGSPAKAQDVNSANWIMDGCRALIANSNREQVKQGLCMGVARVLLNYDRGFGACTPDTATVGQVTRAIALYIDRRPSRSHEPFEPLAIEALKAAWPCKKTQATGIY